MNLLGQRLREPGRGSAVPGLASRRSTGKPDSPLPDVLVRAERSASHQHALGALPRRPSRRHIAREDLGHRLSGARRGQGGRRRPAPRGHGVAGLLGEGACHSRCRPLRDHAEPAVPPGCDRLPGWLRLNGCRQRHRVSGSVDPASIAGRSAAMGAGRVDRSDVWVVVVGRWHRMRSEDPLTENGALHLRGSDLRPYRPESGRAPARLLIVELVGRGPGTQRPGNLGRTRSE